MDETNLTLQMQSAKYVNSICKWMKFFGIVMVIMIALMFIYGILCITIGTALGIAGSNSFPALGIVMGALYIVTSIIYIIPTIYMLRAAKAGKAAVALHDNTKMVEFARNSKSYWKFNGIVAIIFLSIAVLCILGGIIVFAALGSAL